MAEAGGKHFLLQYNTHLYHIFYFLLLHLIFYQHLLHQNQAFESIYLYILLIEKYFGYFQYIPNLIIFLM